MEMVLLVNGKPNGCMNPIKQEIDVAMQVTSTWDKQNGINWLNY